MMLLNAAASTLLGPENIPSVNVSIWAIFVIIDLHISTTACGLLPEFVVFYSLKNDYLIKHSTSIAFDYIRHMLFLTLDNVLHQAVKYDKQSSIPAAHGWQLNGQFM